MDNVLDISDLPPAAKESVINFYEYIKQKYCVYKLQEKRSKPKRKIVTLMKKGMYTLPDDYVFDREELYD